LHIRAVLRVDNAQETGFVIRDTPVVYNIPKQQIMCCKKTAPLKPVNGKVRIEMLVDRTSIEIFGNGGRMYMPNGVILADKPKSIEIFTKGGDTEIESLEIIELTSAWK